MTEIERAQASDDAFPPAIRGHYSIVLSDSRTMLPGASIGRMASCAPNGNRRSPHASISSLATQPSGPIRDALHTGIYPPTPATAISIVPIPTNVTGSPAVTPNKRLPSAFANHGIDPQRGEYHGESRESGQQHHQEFCWASRRLGVLGSAGSGPAGLLSERKGTFSPARRSRPW
jgi:hypothetical protein